MKVLLELIPLLAFFLAYKYYGIIPATIVAVVLAVIGVIVTYFREKKIHKLQILTVVILITLGLITLLTGDPKFIKMKPTIVNLLFAAILFVGIILRRSFLKDLFGDKISLKDEGWNIISKRWAYFFVFLAIFNEILWRNFSEELWVTFKVFGIFIFTAIFLYTQKSILTKYQDK
jgi:intracellular septation protein